MSAKGKEPDPLSREQIAARAYELYLKEGRPLGRDRAHWQQAESEAKAARQRGQPRAKSTRRHGSTLQVV